MQLLDTLCASLKNRRWKRDESTSCIQFTPFGCGLDLGLAISLSGWGKALLTRPRPSCFDCNNEVFALNKGKPCWIIRSYKFLWKHHISLHQSTHKISEHLRKNLAPLPDTLPCERVLVTWRQITKNKINTTIWLHKMAKSWSESERRCATHLVRSSCKIQYIFHS